ncbi:ribonuclease H-like domain-containing protein [Tanacetum coccineum]
MVSLPGIDGMTIMTRERELCEFSRGIVNMIPFFFPKMSHTMPLIRLMMSPSVLLLIPPDVEICFVFFKPIGVVTNKLMGDISELDENEDKCCSIWYVVPTGRVKVPVGRYVVPTGKDQFDKDMYEYIPRSDNTYSLLASLMKDEYKTWAMKMEYWIMNSDHNLWSIVLNGNSKKKTGRDLKGIIMILPPVSVKEHITVQRETKVRTILLQSLPEDHMVDFHHLDDARDIWLAVKARFGGNDESKKMRKSMLKKEFSEFRVSESEGLHKGYDSVLHSFIAKSDPHQQITYEDFDQIGKLDLDKLDIKWQMVMVSVRINRFEKKAGRKMKFNNKDAARFGKKKSDHEGEDEEKGAAQVYGMIAGDDDDVAAEFALIGLSSQVKLKARFDKWKKSSKNLDKLINSSMSSRLKFGLGFRETFWDSDEVFDPSAPSIFDTTPEDVEGKPLYDRFVKAVGMHVVPSPIIGTFMPPSNKPDFDDTQVTYGLNDKASGLRDLCLCILCFSGDFCVKSSSSKTNDHLASTSSSVDFKTVSKTADQKPSSTIDDPSFSFKENVVIDRIGICCRSVPAGWRNHAARPMTRPTSHYFQHFRSHSLICSGDPRTMSMANCEFQKHQQAGQQAWDWIRHGYFPQTLQQMITTLLTCTKECNTRLSYKAITAVSTISEASPVTFHGSFWSTSIRSIDHQIKLRLKLYEGVDNGTVVDEEKNINPVIEAARSMLDDSKLPTCFGQKRLAWGQECILWTLDYLTDSLGYTRFEVYQICWYTRSSIHEATQVDSDSLGSIDPAASISAGSAEPFPTVIELVHADETSLPPVNLWAQMLAKRRCKFIKSEGMDSYVPLPGWEKLLLDKMDSEDIRVARRVYWQCDEFEVLMKEEFEMSAMGELTFFLGLQVKQKPDRIFISQDKYVQDMLKKFDMEISEELAKHPMKLHSSKSRMTDVAVNCLTVVVRYAFTHDPINFALLVKLLVKASPHGLLSKLPSTKIKFSLSGGSWFTHIQQLSQFQIWTAGINLEAKWLLLLYISSDWEDSLIGHVTFSRGWSNLRSLDIGTEDLATLTALSSLVFDLVLKVSKLESELQAHKLLFKEVVGLDPLINWLRCCSAVPTGGSHEAGIPPSSSIPTDEFAGGSDVPDGATTGLSTVFPSSTTVPTPSFVPAAETIPAGSGTTPESPSSPVRDARKGKGVAVDEPTPTQDKTFKQLEEERLGWEAAQRLQAQELADFEKQRAESLMKDANLARQMSQDFEMTKAQRKRQQEVLASAANYSDAAWDIILARLQENPDLTSIIFGVEFTDDDFAARMVELVNTRRKELAEQRAQERRERPMTPSQLRQYMRTYVKNQGPAVYSTGWTMAQVRKLSSEQLQEEFDKIQRAVAFTRGFKRDGSPMTRASSKKLKTGGDDVNLEDIPDAPVEVPFLTHRLLTTLHTCQSTLKKVGTKKKRLGRKGVHTSQSTIPIEEGDPEAEHKLCIKYASDADSASDDDTPINLYIVVDWELFPTGLGSISAFYKLDNSHKYFTSLREILYLVTRADLMIIYGRVMTFYQDKKAAGAGLVLWGDLKVLMDSPEVNDGSDVWKNQHTWSIQSWKLYSFSGVHVLETVSGLVLHMFVDKKYPLSVNLIERMLDHQLEICHGTVGNELTTAVQLIAFLKKQISDSKRPKGDVMIHLELANPRVNGYFEFMKVAAFGVLLSNSLCCSKDFPPAIIIFLIQEVEDGFKMLLYVVPTSRVKVPAVGFLKIMKTRAYFQSSNHPVFDLLLILESSILIILDPFVESPSGEIKVHIEVLSVLWGNRLLDHGRLAYRCDSRLKGGGKRIENDAKTGFIGLNLVKFNYYSKPR